MSGDNNSFIGVFVPASLKKLLLERAKREDRSLSSLLRQLLAKLLEEKG